MSASNTITPLAHARFEYLDSFHRPRVGMLVNGERFIKWDEYVDEHGLRIASQRNHALALGLFIDFVAAHAAEYPSNEPLRLRALFRDFCTSLLEGTIESGFCKHNLWWQGRTVRSVCRLQRNASAFLDWIAHDERTASIVPRRDSTTSEQLKFWARWKHKKANALLGNLRSRAREIETSHMVTAADLGRSEIKTYGPPRRFPDKYFQTLLNNGFKRRAELTWTSLRDQLILLLLHGAGLRLSDALNLWVTDVYPDPEYMDSVDVRLYHPEEGILHYKDSASGNMVRIKRVEYLKQQYNRVPLRMEPGNKNVGSKNLLYMNAIEKFTLAFWRDQEYGRAFKRLFERYMQSRPLITAHPFLFVTPNGDPMTVKGYEKVHAAAIRRIGLVASEILGTIPHGHRHSYVFCLETV